MKKIYKFLFLTFSIFILAACEEKKSSVSLEGAEYTTGKIISVDEETFLIESTDFKHPGTIMIPKRNKQEIEFTWQIGDELKVYFDGAFKETDPAQINSVVSIQLIDSVVDSDDSNKTSPKEETAEDPFLVSVDGASREMKENEVKLVYEVSGGEFERVEGPKEFDYEVLEGSEVQFKFNSKENVLYIIRSDIKIKIPNEIGAVVKMALDGSL